MTKILVSGANGQLAKNIKAISSVYPSLKFTYKVALELDIANHKKVKSFFKSNNYDYFINCAAYTNVDKAETESESAFNVNQIALKNISEVCAKNNIILIHVSTDFIFDGNTNKAYKEIDTPNPLGVYGISKLKGEEEIKKNTKQFFVIRTSWLYSEYNKNFMKTMVQLSKTRDTLAVVDDQIGSPTYAKDLAHIILKIIETKNMSFGIYNYSNEGIASWYDFAYAILKEINSDIKLLPIKTKDYPTPAKRPIFSVLDKTKIKKTMKIEIPYWKDSLQKAIKNLNIK